MTEKMFLLLDFEKDVINLGEKGLNLRQKSHNLTRMKSELHEILCGIKQNRQVLG